MHQENCLLGRVVWIDLFLFGSLQILSGNLTPILPQTEHFFSDFPDVNKDLESGNINFSLFFNKNKTNLLADFGPMPGSLENK